MLTSTALVLMMSIPALALFYGGMVRAKNMLSVLMQVFVVFSLIVVLWCVYGYSLAFTEGNAYIGGLDRLFMKGIWDNAAGTFANAATFSKGVVIPEIVFAAFQATFAGITCALIVGAFAERMKFSAVMLFMLGWMFLVYFPMAHAIWGITGDMNGVWNAGASIKAIDFAGGTVVHMSSGWSALILCLIVGPRLGFRKTPMPPHSMVLCMIGTGML